MGNAEILNVPLSDVMVSETMAELNDPLVATDWTVDVSPVLSLPWVLMSNPGTETADEAELDSTEKGISLNPSGVPRL